MEALCSEHGCIMAFGRGITHCSEAVELHELCQQAHGIRCFCFCGWNFFINMLPVGSSLVADKIVSLYRGQNDENQNDKAKIPSSPWRKRKEKVDETYLQFW